MTIHELQTRAAVKPESKLGFIRLLNKLELAQETRNWEFIREARAIAQSLMERDHG